MATVHEHIRNSLYRKAHLLDSRSYPAMKLSEWSSEFEQLMRNRLIVGALRYGPMKAPRPQGHTVKLIGMILDRLEGYDVTGNLEMLVDIANLALIEFVHSDHPTKHFKAVDRKE